MPRAKKSTPGAGHNVTALTDEERGALVTYYELKVIEAQRKVDAIQVDLKSARDVVNGHFKRMTADLGFTRKLFEAEVIATGRMTEAEYHNAEKRRTTLHRLAGRQPGEQLDILDAIQDTVDEAQEAERNGYRAGRRADDPTPPDTLSTIFTNDWLRGWHAGQEFNGLQLAKAAEVLARPKPGEMAATPDEAETDPDAEIEDEVKRLEEAGWAQPTANEAEFVESDNGRTVRAA